jgi:UDP-N-acetylmuramate--alanine ligase
MSLFIPDDPRPIHFMGIAGAGMSALAFLARSRGVAISGCDANPAGAADLAARGISVLDGHAADHVEGVKALVYTAAVPENHAELEAARSAGIPVIKRAAALAEVVRHGRTIAVAGTHGKTTTTAMITVALQSVGRDPTGIVGGRVEDWDGNAIVGDSDLYVVEADEYDRSFLELHPDVAVINNVEADHLECYGTTEALESAFVEFAGRASRALVGADDRGAVRVSARLDVPTWKVGVTPKADFRLTELNHGQPGSTARLSTPSGDTVDLSLQVPGVHNLRNAAMALGVVFTLEEDVATAAASLRGGVGVSRRFQVLGTARGITVVDDYAHHATEVAATLGAARQRFPGRRIVAVFQPHLYSRTKAQSAALGIVLSVADLAVVLPIYPAREAPIPGVTGKLVAKAVRRAGGVVEWVGDRRAVPRSVEQLLQEGDVVLTLGAGDITEVGSELLRIIGGAAA